MLKEKKIINWLYGGFYIWMMMGSTPIGIVWYSLIYFPLWLYVLNGIDKRYGNL